MPRVVRVLSLSLLLSLQSSGAAADPERHLAAGRSEVEAGDPEGAAEEFEAGLAEAREEKSPAGLIAVLEAELADVYSTYPELGKEAEAEALLVDARRIVEAGERSGSRNRVVILQRLGGYYSQQGNETAAIPVLEQFLKEAEEEGSIPAARLYGSEEASMLRDAYSAAGNKDGMERLQRLREDPAARRALPSAVVAEVEASRLYLEPNTEAADGAPIYVHFDSELVPLRVAVPVPETPAAGASAEQTRAAAIDGLRVWETAIRKLTPEFRLEFEEANPAAPIQVTWSDRPPGYVGGTGKIRATEVDGGLTVTGSVILSAKPLPGRGERLGLGDVRANATHAFGGALGLGYCWQCDSVRSMGWRMRDELRPTDLDLRTFQALQALSNGKRAGAPTPRQGVLADLPFVNTGDDRHIFVDLAKPGSAPLVVQLDTGAGTTIMTPIYARALGVAARSVKSDQHRRDTVTGQPLLFWITDQGVVSGGDSGWSYALLGGDYLENYVVEIDFTQRRVRLLDPAAQRVGADPPDRPNETVVDMPVSDGCPHARLELGTGSVLALLDTGSMGAISTTEEMAVKLGIAVDPDAPRRKWINVLATSVSAVQRLPLAKLGSVTLADVELDIGLRGEGGVRIERMAGKDEVLIGQGVLRDFVVRFDYPRKKLGLTPVAR